MSVDLKRGETLPIHVNMTFPSLPCDGKRNPLITYKSSLYYFSSAIPSGILVIVDVIIWFFFFL